MPMQVLFFRPLSLFYFADKGKILNKKFELDNVIIFDIDEDKYKKIDNLNLELNFNKNNLINSISNYKFVPFYNYIEHIKTLKKFNLYFLINLWFFKYCSIKYHYFFKYF